jgi:hypothetical protein
MAEVFLCQTCHQRLDLKSDEYVVTNKATARTKSQWVYSHVRCVEGRDAPLGMSATEVETLFRTCSKSTSREWMQRHFVALACNG